MIVVLDENLPPSLARALRELGQPVRHALEVVERGTPDDQLVRAVAELGGCLFSRDARMLQNAATVAALRQHGIHLVVFSDAQLSAFELARLLLWTWREAHRQIGAGGGQFFEITARGQVRELRRVRSR